MYDEKDIKIEQARLHWSCLLVTRKYISRSACVASNGRQGDLSVQTL